MILWFSGTGNSQWCAQLLAQTLNDTSVDMFTYIRNGDSETFTSDDPWVFVVPTYAWRIPRVVRDFMKRSIFKGNTDAYVIMTCGSDIGNAQKSNEELLDSCGLIHKGTLEVVLPENYIALFDVPSSQVIAEQFVSAHEVILAAAHKISTRQAFDTKETTYIDTLKSGVINAAFYPLFVHARKFKATEACIGCGHCVRVCPLGAITLCDTHPVWEDDCTHCMACIAHCPVKAIEYGEASMGKVRYTAQACMPPELRIYG